MWCVVFFVVLVWSLVSCVSVQNLQILVYLLELNLELFYFVTPFLYDVFYLTSAHAVGTQICCVQELLFTDNTGDSSQVIHSF